MFKNRHFMMGLGIGLIVGALLLQLMTFSQGGSKKLWTKEQVEQAAELLNLKIVEHDQELLTEEEWEAKSAQTGQAEDADQASKPGTDPKAEKAEAPAEPKTPAAPTARGDQTGEVSKTAEPKKPETDTPKEPDEPEAAEVQYKITYGNTLTNVADGLYKKGVIDDKEGFLKKARARKINAKIRTGTYSFQVGEDYDSIIDKIIAPKK